MVKLGSGFITLKLSSKLKKKCKFLLQNYFVNTIILVNNAKLIKTPLYLVTATI